MKILVIGSQGQLGNEFQAIQSSSSHDFSFVDQDNLNITKEAEVQNYIQKTSFDIVINCAAYTAVDDAEEDEDLAFAVNEKAVKHLVNACIKHRMKLIHFSTDYVFDGQHHKPYTEKDKVKPLSIYGKSKRAGEKVILKSNVSSLILRTSWLYSHYGQNFMKSMIRLGGEREQLQIVFDQVGTPTHARDLAKAALVCVDQHESWKGKQKLYHFSNEGVSSWFDFAKAIFDKEHIDCRVQPILSKEYPTKAQRPHYSVLDKSQFKSDFKVEIPHWLDSFRNY